MGQIEEFIKLHGVEEVQQGLESVRRAQENVGDSAKEAGQKGAESFGTLDSLTTKLGASAFAMVAGFASISTVMGLYDAFIEKLERIRDLQSDFADKTGAALDSLAGLQAQLAATAPPGSKITEQQTLQVAQQFAVAGGFSMQQAAELGQGADIAFALRTKGGIGGMHLPENLAMATELAGFAGAANMSGAEAAAMMQFLRDTGQLETPDKMKVALSQIRSAAAQADRQLGPFLSQLLGGGKGMAQEGVPFTDIVEIGVMATNAETTADLAKQTMLELSRAATGAGTPFFKALEARARDQGMDTKGLTTPDRIALARAMLGDVDTQAEVDYVRTLLPGEQADRLLRGFRGSSVARLTPAAEAMTGATTADFDETVRDYKSGFRYRARAGAASRDFAEATEGFPHVTYAEMMRQAKSAVERYEARGGRLLGEHWYEGGYSREALEEISMKNAAEQIRDALRAAGVQDADLTGLEDSLSGLGWHFSGQHGYPDKYMREIASQVSALQSRFPVTVNYWNAAYFDRIPGDVDPPVSPNR